MITPPNDRDVYKLTLTVNRDDIDDLKHVNNIVYLKWVQQLAAEHWLRAASPQLRDRCLWVVLRHEIDYYVSAVAGDTVEAYTWVDTPNGPRQQRHVSMQRESDNKVLAYANSTWCLLDRATGKPKRISEEIVACFKLEEGK